MEKIILHIDFDSFFASCEQQFNPRLRGRPIGVTATNGRTAVIAASREAKKRGVKNVMRTFDAKRICPDIQFVPAHFDKYWEISKQFISICKDYSPFTEVFSLDEVFMDVTKTSHLFGGVHATIEHIKKRIKEEIGEYITVSVGISHNKMLAKLASGIKKPNGIFEIKPEDVENVYRCVKLTDICGIGERINLRLNSIGICTLLDLRNASVSLLIDEFVKVEGEFLQRVGLGIDESFVIPYTDPVSVKSVGRNYCLPHNEYNSTVILQNVYELCEEIGIKLRRLGKKARTVGISLRGNVNVHGRKTYTYSFNSGQEIFNACIRTVLHTRTVLEKLGKNNYVRQISVWVSNLQDASTLQLTLFENKEKKQRVVKAIDKINDRFGDHTIRNAFLLYADKLTTKPNGYMADRYERTILQQF